LIRGATRGLADGVSRASVSGLDLDPNTVASQKRIVNPIKTRIVSHQGPETRNNTESLGDVRRSADARARRAARREGLEVRRSRRALSSDNKGGLMLMDPSRNWVIAGERFDVSAEAVVAIVGDAGRRQGVELCPLIPD
jgi:hypothetical protein